MKGKKIDTKKLNDELATVRTLLKDKKIDTKKLNDELATVRTLSPDGLAPAESVVAWARNNTESEWHKNLEWDDTVAGEKYRAQQVRTIIRVIVKSSPETGRMVRAWVSKPSDRVHGGGYQPLDAALATGRMELVNEALKGVRQFRARYTHLPELDPLFDAMDRAVSEYTATRAVKVA